MLIVNTHHQALTHIDAFGHIPDQGKVALSPLGIPLVDNAAVDDLARVAEQLHRPTFLLVVAPPAIPAATGGPVNPVAVF